MDELIKKLEAATAGNVDLDWAISKATGRIAKEWLDDFKPAGMPRYTTSLDFAMTLLPEGTAFVLHGPWPAKPGEPMVYAAGVASDARGAWDDEEDHWGATPALALCIAALTARRATA
jgi:hypothetical protein